MSNNKLRSIDISRRETPTTKSTLDEMQSMLVSTFQLWLPNVEILIKNAEDITFLESMKGDRAARFGVFDKTLATKVSRRRPNCQGASEFQCLNRAHHEIETSTAKVLSEVITDESDTDKPEESDLASEDDLEFEAVSKRFHHS